MRPPLPALGPRGTTWLVVSRVSSATSVQTPAKRLFAARTAEATPGAPLVSCADSPLAAMHAPAHNTTAYTEIRICSPTTRRSDGVERHDIDALDGVLSRQHSLHLHLVSRKRRPLRRHAQERKRVCAEWLCG